MPGFPFEFNRPRRPSLEEIPLPCAPAFSTPGLLDNRRGHRRCAPSHRVRSRQIGPIRPMVRSGGIVGQSPDDLAWVRTIWPFVLVPVKHPASAGCATPNPLPLTVIGREEQESPAMTDGRGGFPTRRSEPALNPTIRLQVFWRHCGCRACRWRRWSCRHGAAGLGFQSGPKPAVMKVR
jgi:hypothetical protein